MKPRKVWAKQAGLAHSHVALSHVHHRPYAEESPAMASCFAARSHSWSAAS